MGAELSQRKAWDIDRVLTSLLGQGVRVAAKAFSPPHPLSDANGRFVPVGNFYLPDNTCTRSLPVFFEGVLTRFERRISLVLVCLDAPEYDHGTSEGTIVFRGKIAVILRGPALLELSYPYHVERLPSSPENYWRDIRFPQAQFEFSI
jgi:hypothetical protein